MIRNILLGNQEGLPWNYRSMWFLVSLFMMRIVSSMLKSKKAWVASFMLLLLFVLMKKQNVVNADVDYFQINTTLLCFPFFSLGQVWKEYSVIQYIDKFRTKLKYTILLLVALLVLYVGIKNGEVNVFRDVYGNSILQFF